MITYIENFLAKETADKYFEALTNNVPWVRRDSTPRMEAFYSSLGKPYTYGSGGFERTYEPIVEMDATVHSINYMLEFLYAIPMSELCFLNRYLNQSDHLGWHADDSPEIDVTRPICVVSLGVEREIWFKPRRCHVCEVREGEQHSGICSVSPGLFEPVVEKQLLKHGSLLIMPPGYQQTHYHRIPKSSKMCGERISLTYRGATHE